MRQSEFDQYIKSHSCKNCDGQGVLFHYRNLHTPYKRCDSCDGFGYLVDNLDTISINDLAFIQLVRLSHRMENGEGWLAFVDYQMLRIDMDMLKRKNLVIERLDMPTPKYDNYRDDFPETFFELTLHGRLILIEPGRFIR